MKRFVLTFLLLLALPGVCFATQSALSGDGYRQALSGYDLSAFEKLGDDANSVLEQLGLDDFDFETVTALDAKSCVQVLGRLVRQNIQTPLRALLSVLSFTLLSAFLTGFSGSGLLGQNSSVYSTASALVIAALIAAQCADTVSLCCATIGICADFVFAFFPAFLVILTVSGSSLTGVSTNTLLLGLAQGLNILSAKLFVPLINCFLALSLCSGVRSSLNIDGALRVVRKGLISLISFLRRGICDGAIREDGGGLPGGRAGTAFSALCHQFRSTGDRQRHQRRTAVYTKLCRAGEEYGRRCGHYWGHCPVFAGSDKCDRLAC